MRNKKTGLEVPEEFEDVIPGLNDPEVRKQYEMSLVKKQFSVLLKEALESANSEYQVRDFQFGIAFDDETGDNILPVTLPSGAKSSLVEELELPTDVYGVAVTYEERVGYPIVFHEDGIDEDDTRTDLQPSQPPTR